MTTSTVAIASCVARARSARARKGGGVIMPGHKVTY
jgi:hypothetical protein